jgi:glycosyltransferase involved in cell wall biosynthesis
MEKSKVVRIITRMNVGGPSIQAALLSAGLDRDRFSPILITGRVRGNEADMGYLAKELGVKPFPIPELHKGSNIIDDLISFREIYKFLKKEKPDVVHTHGAKAGAIGRVAARLTGVPVIIHTFHGHMFHSYFKPFKTKPFLWIERALARITDKIIVISESQKEEIKRYLKLKNDSKLILIPLGFDLNNFLKNDKDDNRNKLRQEESIPEEAIVVGTAGRLTAIKNYEMFIKAAKEIKKRSADKIIKFLIVGDGELKNKLMALSDELGIQKDVIFAGWKMKKELDLVYYRAMDIVVLTSLNEGTPVSLIEALASAKPVVATDVGGVRDVVKDGKSGFVVPSNDINAFSEATLMLVNDKKKRDEFGLYGRDFVKERHSKDKLINAIDNLYCDQLQKKLRLT